MDHNGPQWTTMDHNVPQWTTMDHNGPQKGVKGNLADEVLECLSMVDSSEFVQDFSKRKGKMPNIVCYTENQRKDLLFFLSQKSGNAIGVDRTFNLGVFYVTALVYKNLRVVHKGNESEHPLCIGPIMIHRDATFHDYNYFFATIKSSLVSNNPVDCFEIRLGKDMLIGSDEEKALINAIESNFPASEQFLCTKHLKDGTKGYMQAKVGVPQKDRKIISEKIFGENGLVNADNTADFDARSKKILKDVVKYPKFATYFKKKLKPTVENFVTDPSRRTKSTTTWTNNNCESLNHIMKIDADWKVKTTPALIEMIHEMTQLHFKDLKRALYGEGNYRLFGKYKKYEIKSTIWMSLTKEQREKKFSDFLENKKFPKKIEEDKVKSSYSNFVIPALKTARKPGQRTRPKATKTKNNSGAKKIIKWKAKELRKKLLSLPSDSDEDSKGYN